jgi:hypothetical protein
LFVLRWILSLPNIHQIAFTYLNKTWAYIYHL